MTLNGHVENGKIVLDESVRLTDGMKVRVELLDSSPPNRANADDDEAREFTASFYERHQGWIGSIKDAPSDYARNHDHYLHGQPKK